MPVHTLARPARNPVGVDTKGVVAKSCTSLMGVLELSFLQLNVMYGDLARLGGRPGQTIFSCKASITPFSEAPWLTYMEVDFKEAQEIKASGGTGRAFAFVCFRWERDGPMIAFPMRLNLTAPPTHGHQHISAWKPILYGTVRKQILMDELSQHILQAGTTLSMDLNDMNFENIINDMETLSMVSVMLAPPCVSGKSCRMRTCNGLCLLYVP
ncbi:hypothetical protein DFS33DRAFT_998571 [Desarmillaria ectypa]|nr:hypothetical protein DFS33DRAFT_998571 [Desarmillaria ectypa]